MISGCSSHLVQWCTPTEAHRIGGTHHCLNGAHAPSQTARCHRKPQIWPLKCPTSNQMKNLIIITISILLDESYFKFTSWGHFGLVTILLILFRTSSGIVVSEKRRNTSPEFHEIRLKMSNIPMWISQKHTETPQFPWHGWTSRRLFSSRQLLLAPFVPSLEAAPSRPGAMEELPGLVRQRRMHHTHHQDPTVLPVIPGNP